jgi:medium-chain acyl-[acyl-carrier-protein] hydrolase
MGFYLPTKKPNAERLLYCFHHAGGGPTFYRPWGESLPARVEARAVQLPSRTSVGLQGPPLSMDAMVERLADEVGSDADRPFAFFGHSMGALVAFLLARTLRARGATSATRLYASARRAPHIPNPFPSIAHQPDAEFLASVKKFGALPDAVLQNPDLWDFIVPPLRADFAANEGWRFHPEPPLQVPLVALGGATDERADPDAVAAWSEHTARSFAHHTFPGGHFYLNDVLPALIETLATYAF